MKELLCEKYKAIKSDHTQCEMDAVYNKEEHLAASRSKHPTVNPRVKTVSLWTLHGKKSHNRK